MRAALLVVLAACGSVSGSKTDGGTHADTRGLDGAGGDAPPGPCNLSAPFGTPVNVAALNTNAEDDWAWVSADGLTVYLTSTATGSSDRNIYVSTRASTTGIWSTPGLLGGVNTSTASEERAVVTDDGLTLFLQSDGGTPGALHILVATRASTAAQFSTPSLAAGVNSNAVDGDPWISGDGLHMLLTSTRGGNSNYDLYEARRTSVTQSFGTPTAITELASMSVEDAPVLSADGLELFFASTRGGQNRNDIWHATRATPTGVFGAPSKVTELSTDASEDFPTWLSPDRCTLWFSSDRTGGNGSYDIWMASRPK